MKTLKDFQCQNKKVLLRSDFNVPLAENGEILDDFRIVKALPTINYLLERGAKVILISHLGRPLENQKYSNQKYSLKPIVQRLEELLKKKINFIDDCIGEKVKKEVEKLKSGDIIFLENLRFYEQEEKNDSDFAKELSKLGEIFINNAFGSCHREHASIVRLPKYLPSGAGFLLEKEIKILSKIFKEPWRPLVIIIGGVKVQTKIKAIKNFLQGADDLLLGGEIANVILRAKEICVGKPLPESKTLSKIEELEITNPKLHLPIDVIVSPDRTGKVYIKQSGPGVVRRNEEIFDIGAETVRMFGGIIQGAKMIIWSGPLGFFENPVFEKGTREISEKIARNHQAFKIVGGGDTISALRKFHLIERFDFVSTGGGAMLRFLGGENLPGIKALEDQS